MLAQMVAVVADEDHHRAVGQAEPVQLVEHDAELRVHEAHRGVVRLRDRALQLFVHAVVRREDRQRRCRLALPVARRVLGQGDPLRRVQDEVVLGRDVRRVRAEESDGQEERLVLDARASSRQASAAILPSVCSASVPSAASQLSVPP